MFRIALTVLLLAATAAFSQGDNPAPEQELQPISFALQYKQSVYTAIIDPNTGRLDCVSDNPGCQWRVTVAERLRSLADFAAVATPGGPVFITSRDNQVKYALLQYQSGKTVTPLGNAPLAGNIGPGALESAVFEVGEFGAKATIEAREDAKLHTYRWDINVHGTSKQTDDPVTVQSPDTISHAGTGIAFSPPRGLAYKLSEDSVTFTGPLPGVRMMVIGANAGLELKPYTEQFMAQFSVDAGFAEESREEITVGADLPGYVINGQGTVAGQPGGFMLLIFTRGTWSYVMVYGAVLDRYDAYFDAFPALVSGLALPG